MHLRRGVSAIAQHTRRFHLATCCARPTRHVSRTAGVRNLCLVAHAVEEAQDLAAESSYGACIPGSVMLNNNVHEAFTEFIVEAQDYPGLLRVVAWVLNGLGMRVHNAVLKTAEDGMAKDIFCVTDLYGKKLPDGPAEAAAERLQDYINYCQPDDEDCDAQDFHSGDIQVSNTAHPTFTQVTVVADLNTPGLLLELASVLTGQGISIGEAVIVGGGLQEGGLARDLLTPASQVPEVIPGKRVLRFWVKDAKENNKLDYSAISALVYTLGLIMGQGRMPTTPPNRNLSVVQGGCDCATA